MSPEPEASAFPERESAPRGHAPFRETLGFWAGKAEARGGAAAALASRDRRP